MQISDQKYFKAKRGRVQMRSQLSGFVCQHDDLKLFFRGNPNQQKKRMFRTSIPSHNYENKKVRRYLCDKSYTSRRDFMYREG